MLHSFRLVQHSDMRIEAVNEAQTVMNLIRSANTHPDNFPEIVTNAFPAGVYIGLVVLTISRKVKRGSLFNMQINIRF